MALVAKEIELKAYDQQARNCFSVTLIQEMLSISSWGPAAWHTLHAVAFTYPVRPTCKERRAMHQFLHSFSRVLPCKACAGHCYPIVRKHVRGKGSPVLDCRESLSRWTVDLHNQVNRRLSKPEMPFEEVVRLYGADVAGHSSGHSSPRKGEKKALYFLLPIVALVLLLVVIALSRR